MSDLKVIKLPSAIAAQLIAMSMADRAAFLARAFSAPQGTSGVVPLVAEPVAPAALPDLQAELSPGSILEPGEGAALLRLPEDCRWFVSLDDASRADAVRRSLARCREVEALNDVDLRKTELDRLREIEAQHERPANIPNTSHWVGVVVWVPRVALVITSIQDVTLRALKAEVSPSLHDPDEVFQTEDAT